MSVKEVRLLLPDVAVRQVDRITRCSNPVWEGSDMQVSQDEFAMHVAEVGDFYVRDGKEVEYSVCEGTDPGWVRLYLNGQVLVALLHQRKIINLHSSSFIHDGRRRFRIADLHLAPAVSIDTLIVPLFDSLCVVILRLRYHQSPLMADHRHIHHMMLRAGFSHRQATLYVSLFNVLFIYVTFLLDKIGILMLGLVLLSICLAATYFLNMAVKRSCSSVSDPVEVSNVSELAMVG